MKLLDPALNDLSPRHLEIYWRYQVVRTGVDFGAALCFIIGSAFFFFRVADHGGRLAPSGRLDSVRGQADDRHGAIAASSPASGVRRGPRGGLSFSRRGCPGVRLLVVLLGLGLCLVLCLGLGLGLGLGAVKVTFLVTDGVDAPVAVMLSVPCSFESCLSKDAADGESVRVTTSVCPAAIA